MQTIKSKQEVNMAQDKKEETEEKVQMKGKEAEGMVEEEDLDKEPEEVEEEEEKEFPPKDEEEEVEKAGLEENPEESADESQTAEHTTTPGKVIQTRQNVKHGPSTKPVGRNGSGKTPSEVSYSGKSAQPDLRKSPLYTSIQKDLVEIQKAVNSKVAALEKSVTARLNNLLKSVETIEKADAFYKKHPFYKAIDENAAPEGVQQKGFAKLAEEGKVVKSF